MFKPFLVLNYHEFDTFLGTGGLVVIHGLLKNFVLQH